MAKQTLRSVKGSALTYGELDENFTLTHEYVVDSSETDQGATGNSNTLKAHITAIGSNERHIYFPAGNYTLTTSVTVPSNITLHFAPGAVIDGAGTLTINGPICAGLYKIFGSTITTTGVTKNTRIYPQWWGALGDGTNDDTVEIQAAIDHIAQYGGVIYLKSGVYIISSAINLPAGNSINVKICGVGKWGTVVRRDSSFTSGNLFNINGSFGTGCSTVISNLRIENATTFNHTSGSAIDITNSDFVDIEDVWITNGYNGISVTNSDNIYINNCTYIQESPYAALGFQSNTGLLLTGTAINNIFVSNSKFYGQNPDSTNNLTYGILIHSADGAQFVNCAINGKYGVALTGGNSYNIDDVYFSNCIIDNVSIGCVLISGTNSPNVFTNIRFADCHLNAGDRTTGQNVVSISGDCDYVQIIDCNINLGYGAGVYIDGSASYIGGSKQSVIIDSCDISENNLSNTANTHGITLANNSTGITIKNNKIRNRTASGHQKYGIAIGTGCSDLDVQSNALNDNETGAIVFGATPTTSTIVNNPGYNDTEAATTILVGASPFTYSSGHSPETIYISGGTVSDISQASTTIAAATGLTAQMGPNESIIVTYSVAPTMISIRH